MTIPPVATIPNGGGGTNLVPPPPALKLSLKYSKRCPSLLVLRPLGFEGVPVLSVVLTGALATYLANYIQKHLWIAYIGLGFILLVAIQLVIGGLVDLEILNINEKYIKYF